jgi:nucleotide-binding universal stress UspA family protein
MMLKALVPVDGSSNALCAVRHVIKLVQDREPLDIHLLNVQPPLHGDVTAFVADGNVKAFHREEGEKALRRACELLTEAGLPFTKHVYVGQAAEVIADCAGEMRFDKVVMGTRGRGTFAQLLMGSVTHEAIHRMSPDIPVTLVKDGYRTPTSGKAAPSEMAAARNGR